MIQHKYSLQLLSNLSSSPHSSLQEMDLSSTQHHLHSHFAHQEMNSEHSDSVQNKQQQQQQQQQHEDMKKPRPQDAEPQKCPRCDSSNTKFCYYNNYSLTQPRYFCKACRRYWTKGGTLRNVPVGGGCRKSSKRSNYTSSSPSHFIKRAHTKEPQMIPDPTPNPVFSGLNINPYGFNFDSIMMTNANFTNSDSAMNLLSHPHSSFLQELQYGNNGLMFQNLCNYDEIGSRNGSNCVSGISEDMAAMAPYEDVLSSGVKQEANENEALFSLPWQNINNEQDLVRENWNGLFGNSAAFGLLNTPAMM